MEKHNIDIFKKINELVTEGEEFVLATIIEASIGTPGRLGFKMIINHKESFGTVGGGELEFQTSIEMKNILNKEKRSKIIKYSLTPDLKMACGGKVKIFLEYFPSAKRAWLFGAGHMGISLTPLLSSIGFRVTVIDNREDFALKEKFKDADNVILKDYLDFAREFTPRENDSIIIFTYGHEYDYDILKILAQRDINVKYLGVIGAKSKIKKIKNKIKTFEYGDLIDNIFAPIGLNIARRTTPEISIAIAAEIVAIYNGVEDIKMMSRIK